MERLTLPAFKVGALVLAAGQSRRMGAPKLAMEVDGVAVLARTLDSVRKANLPLLLVTGGNEAAVLAVAGAVPRVRADRFDLGLAESLKAGLRAAPDDWDAALVVLGDMPFVLPATLQRLAATLAGGAVAVVPVKDGRRGNPAGFSRPAWNALLALDGDAGARAVLDRLGAVDLPVDDAGIHRDIDTPADLNGRPS